MRIIKFRGKSLNTKMWVYGDLNHRGKRTFIEYEVDCKTISQFIGKTDKEGTEIYEHDIISVNGKYPKLVKYIDEYACFCLANISDLNKEWTNPWQQISPDWWNDFKREIRVIGNAFDNPELMRGGGSTMNIPYRTSRDYQLLKKLLDEGKEIVCFADFPIDNRIFRDVCKARKTGEGRYSITCRGCEYASFWENHNYKWTFEDEMQMANIEFIEPNI